MEILGRFLAAAFMAITFHLERWWREYLLALAIFALALLMGYSAFLAPPAQFPRGAIVTIAEGAALPQAAAALSRGGVIAHPQAFELLVRLLGVARHIHPGPYRFDASESAVTVALRITRGDSGIAPLKITFPEGSTVRNMAALLAGKLPLVGQGAFSAAATSYEGYLFPDTYFFPASETTEGVIQTLRDTFTSRTESLMPQIRASGRSLAAILTMASLLEKEAKTSADRRIVAGILWKRADLHMPLQVDAVFGYIFHTDTYSPTLDDLKVDSPYNTYTHAGLPPGPIDNPGLDAIEAALTPTPTEYLYYLTGSDGQMHYATTFAGHEANREKYLK